MRKSVAAVCILALVSLLLAGCAEQTGQQIVADRCYTYSGESFFGLENDPFTIAIHEDGTFWYYESALSSHIGIGTWSVADDMLTLTEGADTERQRINHFLIDGDDLVFVEEDSNNFIYICVDDGELFYGSSMDAE